MMSRIMAMGQQHSQRHTWAAGAMARACRSHASCLPKALMANSSVLVAAVAMAASSSSSSSSSALRLWSSHPLALASERVVSPIANVVVYVRPAARWEVRKREEEEGEEARERGV